VVSHKHALELKRCADTRGRKESKEIKRDETVQEIKERGAGFRTQTIITFSVILTFRCFARTPPIGKTKRSQLTDHRAIEKGVDTEELIKQRLKLIASSTQVGLHLLNFRADDPDNWEVTEFLLDRVLNWRLLDPRVMIQNPRAEEKNSINHSCDTKK